MPDREAIVGAVGEGERRFLLESRCMRVIGLPTEGFVLSNVQGYVIEKRVMHTNTSHSKNAYGL